MIALDEAARLGGVVRNESAVAWQVLDENVVAGAHVFHLATTFVAITLLLVAGCASDGRRSSEVTPRAAHSNDRREPTGHAVELHGEPSQEDRQFEYEGLTIIADERVDPPQLTIDGRAVAVRARSGAAGKVYGAAALNYAEYSSLVALAKAMIDSGLVGPATGEPAH